jgi:hypothetical protein
MAGHRLRDGLSFCRIGERSLFLDLVADRYFCLSAPLDRAFSALCGTEPADPALASTLVEMGILIASRDALSPSPCAARSWTTTAKSDPHARPSIASIAMALARRALWSRRVGRRPLAQNVQYLERQKQKGARTGPPPPAAIARIEGAYRRAALIVPTRDRCLATSMALMSALMAQGARADLVLGVKLDPFQAHCWVELDGAVIGDEPDLLRPFSPILVV